jgi:hypothetical protein
MQKKQRNEREKSHTGSSELRSRFERKGRQATAARIEAGLRPDFACGDKQ